MSGKRTCPECFQQYKPLGWPMANWIPFCSKQCEDRHERREGKAKNALASEEQED